MLTIADLSDRRIHFIGLGGAGMSGIARIMLAKDFTISGSDAKDSSVLQGLQALGAKIYVGHSASHVAEVDLVVASSAINEKNPELVEARSRNIEILTRAQALAILMSESIAVAVAGTHGKTTTTSMLTVALQQAGLDPSFAIGGMINNSGTNAHLGSGSIFVAEADESDGSFLEYRPFGAIVTNIELDHVDHFASFNDVLQSFLDFTDTIKPGGFLVACTDDSGVSLLLTLITRTDLEILTYGQSADMSISRTHLRPLGSTSRIILNGVVLGELALSVPGAHNVLNATAALAAGTLLTATTNDLFDGLHLFSGTKRRFEVKGSVKGVTVVDDYGHHPTEIAVTLEAARRFAQGGRVFVIFQPHRFSRTQAFATEFAGALNLADRVFVTEIYPASETPIPGVTSELITRNLDSEKAKFQPSMIELINEVVTQVREGDLIVTLGAGDVSALAPVILTSLAEK